MKRIKLLALAIAIGTSSLFATEIAPDIPVKEVRNQIEDLFATPNFNVAEDVTVNVFYRFSEDGHIYVLWVESYNRDIVNYVHKNMHNKMVEIFEITNKVYTLPLKFEKNIK